MKPWPSKRRPRLFFKKAEMNRDEGTKVRCPACGWFVCKVKSLDAEVEMNCVNMNCKRIILVTREHGDVTCKVLPNMQKQA